MVFGTRTVRFTAADRIIFLDLPPLVCLWGILRRLRYRAGSVPWVRSTVDDRRHRNSRRSTHSSADVRTFED